jgi:signal transduction histidine kinase
MSQPLTALRGTLELALLKASSIREHRISEEKALAAAEELARILQGVRELAEAYTPVGETVPVELSELVREVVEDLRPIALSRRVAIQLDAAPGIYVLGDRPRLYGALLKIVHLAVERNSPRSGVRVSLRVAGEDAQIAVEDEGPQYPEGSGPGPLDLSLMTEAPEFIWDLGAAAKMVESSSGLLTTENLAPRGRRILVRLPRRSEA